MPNYYNPYYPQGYYQQQQMAPQMQAPAPATQPQIQNGGFVSVRNEMEARNYPVAPGNSITFKDETAPYVYTKTMGFSQLDRPIFDKYKLVKEEVADVASVAENSPNASVVDTSAIDEIKDEIEAIWGEIDGIKKKIPGKPAPASKKKEVDDE